MKNFVSQPTIEAMQTLLIIGNVLSHNMNPGVSYVLLGRFLRCVFDPASLLISPRYDSKNGSSIGVACRDEQIFA